MPALKLAACGNFGITSSFNHPRLPFASTPAAI